MESSCRRAVRAVSPSLSANDMVLLCQYDHGVASRRGKGRRRQWSEKGGNDLFFNGRNIALVSDYLPVLRDRGHVARRDASSQVTCSRASALRRQCAASPRHGRGQSRRWCAMPGTNQYARYARFRASKCANLASNLVSLHCCAPTVIQAVQLPARRNDKTAAEPERFSS